jgi:alkylhydroperoxidase family enzyme
MRRYIITDYDEANQQTRDVYDDYMRSTGDTKVPLWLKSIGHNSDLAKGYWERAKTTLFSGSLPLPLKEMIVFLVSAKHGARYCSACHARNLLSLDKALAFEDLQTFLSSDTGVDLPVYYRSVGEFVIKVVTDPNCLLDEDYTKLMDEGFSQEEVCEIISVIDLATMFNVYTSSLNLDLDEEYRAII